MELEKWRQPDRWEPIRNGVSLDRVRELLGDPLKAEVDREVVQGHEITVWFYGQGLTGGQIQFYDRQVMGWVVPDLRELAETGDRPTTVSDPMVAIAPHSTRTVSYPFLQAPYIQLGFFWHDRREEASYREILRWLLAHGYRILPPVNAIRSRNGRMPRFAIVGLDWIGSPDAPVHLPDVEFKTFDDWDAGRALGATDWFPVDMRLLPTQSANVQVDLAFAGMAMAEKFLHTDEPHAIEITASGEDCSVVHTRPEFSKQGRDLRETGPEIVEGARRTQSWRDRVFRAICDELSPDYAKDFLERSLQPPSSLIASDDVYDYGGLYLAAGLLGTERDIRGMPAFQGWKIVEFQRGVHLTHEDMLSLEARAGIQRIRQAVRNGFGGIRKRDVGT